jgi:hypothetical protein
VSVAVNDLLSKDEDALQSAPFQALVFGVKIVYNYGHSGSSLRYKKCSKTHLKIRGMKDGQRYSGYP